MHTTTTMNATVNGIDMRCEVRGEGEPLVLLHGFFGTSGDWVHLFNLEELERSYRVIAPDLRGHGGSTNPSGAFTHRQCADDVLALLDQLGVDRFKAVGVSLGGNTLLHAATRERDRIAAMVLTGAPSYFPQQARAIMGAVPVDDRGHGDDEWQALRQRHTRGDDQIRGLWRIANGFQHSYDDMTFTPPSLATIRARTLIVTGDRDPLYPLEIFVEQYRAIPRSALYVIPNGGHDAVFGEARESFVRAALGFLAAGTT